ncbi:Fic family protein [Blautia producta]|uniref:Adenosine monophosphate-protein transferase SoFic n=1 Tax=Blautia producta TaxID=33035 RepID=A0A4P6LWP5_9FIRM|nr:Fic family protein [Blautia producta]QBE96954.1 Adenosine monophosphate-protein transferase SoFic [Blautia producta]
MKEYKPPYSITEDMLNLVASISEKLGEINVYHNLDAKPHLRKSNRIKSIHSSLKIEANSLSIGEVRDVIDGRIVLGPEREIQEVKNAYEAYELIKWVDAFSIKDLQKVHRIMAKKLELDAGSFRNGDEGVFNGDQCIFMAPPAHLVQGLMSDLFSWMKKNKNMVHPLIMSAVFHYEFVFIHPFTDGNGRTARLWHTVILSKWNSVFEYIPIESQIEKFQDGYYKAIADCHVNGNSNVFIEFMLKQIDAVIGEIVTQIRRPDDTLSEYVKKLLNVMDFEVPYSAATIMQMLGIKSRETLRKNYLDPALKMGLVIRTIPDKPNSKNQRYIKK